MYITQQNKQPGEGRIGPRVPRFCYAIFLLSGLLSVSERANAQSWHWAKSLEYIGYGTSAVDVTSGAVYTTGHFTGTLDFDPGPGVYYVTAIGAIDVYISKLDSSGNFVWAKSYGSPSFITQETYYETYYYGYNIAIDPESGDVYATGGFWSTYPMAPGMFIRKLDSAGETIWMRELGADPGGCDIAIDEENGDVYTTGSFIEGDFDPGVGVFMLTSAGSNDIFISKLDASGNFLWAKAMGGTSSEGGISLAVQSGEGGSVYTTGSFDGTADFDPGAGTFNLTSSGVVDMFISKLDDSGNFLWAKAIGGADFDFGTSIAIDSDGSGDVHTTGTFTGTVDFDPGAGTSNLTATGGDIFISKLDGSGDFVWAKAIGGADWDVGYAIAVGPAGEVYTTGQFNGTGDFNPGAEIMNLTAAGMTDVFVSKLNSSGEFLWAVAAGGESYESGYSVAIDGSGYVNVSGVFGSASITFGATTLPGNGSGNVFITRMDGTTLPCTGIVTNTDDIGIGSLRQNISCALSGDTISFSLPPMSEITLTTGEILINKNLTMLGPGILDLSISSDNSRIFNLLPGSSFAIENLALRKSYAGTNGGAIFVKGNLSLQDVLFEHNFENGTPKGMTLISPGSLDILGNVEIKN